jgi:hypothetical protein
MDIHIDHNTLACALMIAAFSLGAAVLIVDRAAGQHRRSLHRKLEFARNLLADAADNFERVGNAHLHHGRQLSETDAQNALTWANAARRVLKQTKP